MLPPCRDHICSLPTQSAKNRNSRLKSRDTPYPIRAASKKRPQNTKNITGSTLKNGKFRCFTAKGAYEPPLISGLRAALWAVGLRNASADAVFLRHQKDLMGHALRAWERLNPPFLFGLAKEKRAVHGPKRKRFWVRVGTLMHLEFVRSFWCLSLCRSFSFRWRCRGGR